MFDRQLKFCFIFKIGFFKKKKKAVNHYFHTLKDVTYLREQIKTFLRVCKQELKRKVNGKGILKESPAGRGH